MATVPKFLPPDAAAPRTVAPRLTTARLVLRPPEPADAAAVTAGLGHWDVTRMLARAPHPYRLEHAVDWLQRTIEDRLTGTNVYFIVDAGDGAIGCVGLHRLHAPETGSNFGYWLSQAAWGRGYATEAGRAALAYAFDVAGLDAVRSGVFADNFASLRVQDKLGFSETGRSKVFCLARGVEADHIDTILTRARFQSLGLR